MARTAPGRQGLGAPSILEHQSHLTAGITPWTLASQGLWLRIPSSLFLVLFLRRTGGWREVLWEVGGIRLERRTERARCSGQEEEVRAEVRAGP